MKRAFLSRTALFVVMATLLWAGKAEAYEPPTPCEPANALREAGYYEEAQAEYLRLLTEDPSSECALTGLQSLPREQMEQLYNLGKAYEDANRLDLARKAYADALEADPTYREAQEALENNTRAVVEALVRQEFYEEARGVLKEAIKENPNLEVLGDSIELAEVESDLAQAQALAEQGFYEEAATVLKEAIKKDPGLEVPDDLRYLLDLAKAEALAGQGFDEKATEALRGAIEKNPGLKIPDHLKHLLVGRTSLLRRLRKLEPLRPLGELVIAILVVLLVGRKLRLRVWPWSWIESRFFCPRLDIKEFDCSAAGLSIGPGMEAMVEEELTQLTARSEFRRRVHVFEGSSGTFQVPTDAKSALPSPLQVVLGLIEWASSQNVITLTGRLQKSSDRGAGLTLTLVEKRTGNILNNRTIWLQDYDPVSTTPGDKDSDPYYMLAKLAAGWTLFQLAEWRQEPIRLLGAKDWRSYACIQIGLDWRLRGKKAKTGLVRARRMFLRALSQDPSNQGALFNLATSNIELGNYSDAQKQLEIARQQLEEAAKEESRKVHQDRMWYQIIYYQAGVHAYNGGLKPAAGIADGLVGCIQQKLNEFKRLNGTPYQKVLNDLFNSLASISQASNDREKETAWNEIKTLRGKIGELGKPPPYSLRNHLFQRKLVQQRGRECKRLKQQLALLEKGEKGLKLERISTLIDKIQNTLDALKELDQKLGRQPEPKDCRLEKYLEWLEPLAVTLLVGVKAGQDEIWDAVRKKSQTMFGVKEFELHYRVQYNLACCYSVFGEKIKNEELGQERAKRAYQKSLEYLERVLGQGGGIVQWAQEDPSLRGVREEKTLPDGKKAFAEMFKELIEEYAQSGTPKPTEGSLPLAGLAAIGNVYAGKLKGKGIVSVNDLIVNTCTHQRRQKLVNDLGTDVMLVQRWGLLADLMHIVGNVQYVNLLEAAGVYSCEMLRGLNPLRLQELLYQVNQARSLADQAPQPRVVLQWVSKAKPTILEVEE